MADALLYALIYICFVLGFFSPAPVETFKVLIILRDS